MSEAALIQACCEGDAQAWEALRGRYHRVLHGALREAGAREDIEDLEQEVWARLLARERSALRSFRGGSFAAFLARVARSVCIDHHRRARPLTELTPAMASERPSAEHRLSHEQERSRLWKALQAMPLSARDRDVLRLHFEEEMTAADIGDLGLGLSSRGVEALLRRVRTRLAESLREP